MPGKHQVQPYWLGTCMLICCQRQFRASRRPSPHDDQTGGDVVKAHLNNRSSCCHIHARTGKSLKWATAHGRLMLGPTHAHAVQAQQASKHQANTPCNCCSAHRVNNFEKAPTNGYRVTARVSSLGSPTAAASGWHGGANITAAAPRACVACDQPSRAGRRRASMPSATTRPQLGSADPNDGAAHWGYKGWGRRPTPLPRSYWSTAQYRQLGQSPGTSPQPDWRRSSCTHHVSKKFAAMRRSRAISGATLNSGMLRVVLHTPKPTPDTQLVNGFALRTPVRVCFPQCYDPGGSPATIRHAVALLLSPTAMILYAVVAVPGTTCSLLELSKTTFPTLPLTSFGTAACSKSTGRPSPGWVC
jgi:hypothetical protein